MLKQSSASALRRTITQIRCSYKDTRHSLHSQLPRTPASERQIQQSKLPNRRDLLLGLLPVTAAAASCFLSAQPASAAALADADSFLLSSSVVPALTVDQYLSTIISARPAAFRELADLIDNSKFKECSEALVLAPFDDIMRSAFYLPWAMLKSDTERAGRCRESYLTFLATVQTFEKTCLAATRYQVEDEEVLAGMADMSKALDALLVAASA